MTGVWIGVLAVGAASLAFRWIPMVAVHRVGLRPKTADLLRHAGAGAIAALVVLALLRPGGATGVDAAMLAAVAVGGVLAWRGRSMVWVVLCGGAAFAVVTAVGRLL
jgi:branched-subunit amino acid transport protein